MLNKSQLKEARSILGREQVKKRWEKTSKEDRSNHARKMAKARHSSKKLSTE